MEERIQVSEETPWSSYTHRYNVTATLEYLIWLLDPFQNPEDWQEQRALPEVLFQVPE